MTVIGSVRKVLRRNEAVHGQWERLKRSPAVHPLILRRATRRTHRPAADVLRRRGAVDHVLTTVHQTLDTDDLEGRWHLYGGALLGWARQGRMLDHDLNDVDIAIDEAALPELVRAIDHLCLQGFNVERVYVSNDGTVREIAVARDDVRVDLFVFRNVHGFWDNRGFGDRHGRQCELVSMIPRQPLERITLSGLPWPKVVHHEVELEAIYGDWRQPDPTWKFGDDRTVVRAEEWTMHSVPVEAGLLALRAQATSMSDNREQRPAEWLRVRQ
jgi:hypothetical protein